MLHSVVLLYRQHCFIAFIHVCMFMMLLNSLPCLYNFPARKRSIFLTPLFNSITIYLRYLLHFICSFKYSGHVIILITQENLITDAYFWSKFTFGLVFHFLKNFLNNCKKRGINQLITQIIFPAGQGMDIMVTLHLFSLPVLTH